MSIEYSHELTRSTILLCCVFNKETVMPQIWFHRGRSSRKLYKFNIFWGSICSLINVSAICTMTKKHVHSIVKYIQIDLKLNTY